MASNTSGNNHHREHARHNKKVYDHLRDELEYIDWIITTAFYTTLHFVEYKIYPFTIKIGSQKHKFESTSEYKPYSGKRSKHGAKIKAVKNNLSSCKVAYKELFDLSMTARYHQYQFENPERVDKMVNKWLSHIIKECNS